MALSNVKGFHTTPGIYQKETEMRANRETPSGITSLGLVGETLHGPAMTPIFIDSWKNFTTVFGGTSAEQYTGSKYPRYELPYIAQDYLTESSQLYVTRVLGLSGYNAGKAWVIKAIGTGDGKDMLIGVIRSRGSYVKTYGLPTFSDKKVESGDIEEYYQYVVGKFNPESDDPIAEDSYIEYPEGSGKKYTFGQKFFGTNESKYGIGGTQEELTVYGYCGTNYEYDKFNWDVENVFISTAGQASAKFDCGMSGKFVNSDAMGVPCTPNDLGTFKLVCELRNDGYSDTEYVAFTVSLNSASPDYIYNVLGGTPQGVTPIWIEELYDVALSDLVGRRTTDPVNFIEGILLGNIIKDSNDDTKSKFVYINGEPTLIYDGLTAYGNGESIISHFRAVNSILTKVNSDLTESDFGNRFLYTFNESKNTDYIDDMDGRELKVLGDVKDDGKILVVKRDVDGVTGKISYNYHFEGEQLSAEPGKNKPTEEYWRYVFVSDQNIFYQMTYTSGGGKLLTSDAGDVQAVLPIDNRCEKDGICGVIGSIVKIDIKDGGKGYRHPVYVEIEAPTGRPSQSARIVDVKIFEETGGGDGSIYELKIDSGGLGYNKDSKITVYNYDKITGDKSIPTKEADIWGIWGAPVDKIEVITKNENYQTRPWVTVEPPVDSKGEICGTTAVAEAVINPQTGVLLGIAVIDGGSGYQTPPKVIVGVEKGKEQTYTNKVVGDVSDYKESYRTPVTPWIVSHLIGTYKVNEVKKLFRFFTISDGSNANVLCKVSIMNIDPETLSFDVVIRDFYDSDGSPKILESFKKCNLNPASSGYILNKIGDINGSTIQRSSYVMVEVAENETIKYCIPAGFLGVPVRYFGAEVRKPKLGFNTTIFEGIKPKRQFFGFSDLVGIDVDSLTYKGRSAYTDGYYTDGFHLDSRISNCNTVVDGVNTGVNCTHTNKNYHVNGVFTWQTPSMQLGDNEIPPMITNAGDILGGIYEDVNYRKFTVCFYGGFDGWDPYRTYRTTGNDFKRNKYKGRISTSSGSGDRFSVLLEDYGITNAITSDYYAFLAAYETMSNPFATPINILATPGIDYVNDTLLVKDVIEIVERDYNQKTIYFVTTPDKPLGANENPANMFSCLDAVGNLDVAEIDSSYAATFFPWCQYYDMNENKTIFLPITKDIIRLTTQIDNTSYSWYPAAGINNGEIDCIGPRKILKMEETDILTSSRINPVVKFSKQGVYSWGQKNLKVSYDNDREPLTRIGVRRMVIRLKEMVEHVNRGLLFTPNDMTTANKFKSNTNAILNDVRSNRGISDYRIEVDNSVEARENRTLPAKIWIKPNNMLEFIEIEWVITPQGMEMV